MTLKQIIQNILIVEDDDVAAKIIAQALRHMFPDFVSSTAVVVFAKTIDEAVHMIVNGGPFDLITLDGDIGKATASDLLPLLEKMGYLERVLMLPGTPSAWEKICSDKGITLIEKMTIKTIPPDQLFTLVV